jgi:integrase/recombinase XerD
MTLSLQQALDPSKLIDGYEEDSRLRGLSSRTITGYRANVQVFMDFLSSSETLLEEVDSLVLRDFLGYLKDERSLHHKTIKRYFSALSGFYDYLVYMGFTQTNIVLPFRRRYLTRYKENYDSPSRKLISVEEMSMLVNSILDPRDRAIVITLAKTGIRRGELLRIEVDDVDWESYSITLKPARKRSNRVVFFDDETAYVLRKWLNVRRKLNPRSGALFISYNTLEGLSRNGAYNAFMKHAVRLSLHDSGSESLGDRFSPHCCRHWFTTWLLRNGMRRDYVKELRGDRRGEAIDIYNHIDSEELRKAYLAFIPKLGVF